MRAGLAGIAVLVWAATAAAAQEPLDGDAFEAFVTGQTVQFHSQGRAYGAEQYLPGRRVVWAFENGPCQHGIWYEPEPGAICFVYEEDPTPQCWHFFDEGGRLRARFLEATGQPELVETARSRAPLACPGPDVGA